MKDDDAKQDFFEISTGQWEEFVAFLGRIGFGSWDAEYESNGIMTDGTSWNVVAVIEGERVESSRANAFPEGWEKLTERIGRVFGGVRFY